jgi:dihydroflavonol-4-reductase
MTSIAVTPDRGTTAPASRNAGLVRRPPRAAALPAHAAAEIVLATIQMSLIYRYMFGGAIHVAGTADVDFLVPRFIATGVLFSGIGNVTAGDVLDAASVQAAVEGCDALINAAAVFSLDPGEAETMLATNTRATEIVLEAAIGAGLDPIVHVSSYVALLPSPEVLGPDSPVGVGAPAYPRSKAQSELIARRHQADGAPVVTTYPGAVVGPDDPYLRESDFMIAMILRNRVPFAVPGGWPIAEVRYVANGHAAILEPGRGPRRYFLTGHWRTWKELYASLRGVTGRRLPAVPTPGFLGRASGRAMDGLQRLTRARPPFSHEGSWIVTGCRGTDDSATRQDLEIKPPPLEQTLADTIRWMIESGHLPASLAGEVASAHGDPPEAP